MGLNEVFKKVSAINDVTELAKHEVELGIKEDVSKLNQESSKVIKSVGGAIVDIDKSYDVLIKNTRLFESDKKQFVEVKKQYDFITGKFNQSSNDLKNNISNSDAKIKNVKAGQTSIKNIIAKAKAIKFDIEQTSKELGIDAKSSKQYSDLIQTIDNLDMLLEDSAQAIVSYERELNSAKSLIK
jgi:hypothetical protein